MPGVRSSFSTGFMSALIYSIQDSTELAIQEMIEANHRMLNMNSQGEQLGGMSPPLKGCLELEIMILENVPRDADKLEWLLKVNLRHLVPAMFDISHWHRQHILRHQAHRLLKKLPSNCAPILMNRFMLSLSAVVSALSVSQHSQPHTLPFLRPCRIVSSITDIKPV